MDDDHVPGSPAKPGLTDAELAIHPTVFAADALKDQVVVVSGGAGGIGRAIAWLFARLGAHVAVVGRDREKLDALVAELASRELKASAYTADIREPDAVSALFDSVWTAQGRVDILVNSAGGQFPQAAIDFSIKGWNAVIDTNLNGTWYMMQAAAQRWRDRKHPGSIVNIVVVTTHGLYGIAQHRREGRRHRPVAQCIGRMGAAEHSRQLRGARRDRDRGLEGLYAASPRRLSPFQSDDARRLALGYRRSLRLPRRALGTICHRRDADGGRRRSALGRDLDHGETGIFRWWG
jgi:NAD(P)-dependent dehydrogenase (short-subunit alcohol dehydrogenase family)